MKLSMILGILGSLTPRERVSCSLPASSLANPPSSLYKLSNLSFMSYAQSTASSSPNFQLVINNALDKYKKRTKNDLLAHPLAAQLQSCDSPSAILVILQQQVQGLDQSRSSDEQWSRWLDPTINILYALNSTLGAGVGLVCLRTELVRDLHSYFSGRYSRQRLLYFPGSASSFQCVPFLSASCAPL